MHVAEAYAKRVEEFMCQSHRGIEGIGMGQIETELSLRECRIDGEQVIGRRAKRFPRVHVLYHQAAPKYAKGSRVL